MNTEDEKQDAMDEDAASRRYRQSLSRNPDCRDPDHPGCESCNDSSELEVEECEECGQILDECWCDGFNEIEETEE